MARARLGPQRPHGTAPLGRVWLWSGEQGQHGRTKHRIGPHRNGRHATFSTALARTAMPKRAAPVLVGRVAPWQHGIDLQGKGTIRIGMNRQFCRVESGTAAMSRGL